MRLLTRGERLFISIKLYLALLPVYEHVFDL